MVQQSSSRTKRAALGRGLSALIPPRPSGPLPGESMGMVHLPIERIEPNQNQPRHHFDDDALAELSQSIKEHGILQPIVVRRQGPQEYCIVAGERRWRAAQKAGLKEIPALISEHSQDDSLMIALVENIQREDLNPIEEAEAYRHLSDVLGLSQEDIAERVGKNRATVANSMRLLQLPENVLDLVSNGDLSMGHARALLSLDKESTMESLANTIVRKKLSVRDVERRVKLSKSNGKEEAKPNPRRQPRPSPALRDVTEKLMRALGTKVVVKQKTKSSGTIEIAYHSLDEFDRLLEIMCK